MMKSPSSQVDAIVINHNTRSLLLECLASLERAREAEEIRTIIVIDSQSSDGSIEAVRARYSHVKGIVVKNHGYGSAANAGLKQSDGEYALILNADTSVPEKTVSKLHSFLERYPEVAVAGPRLRYPNGAVQESRRRFPERITPLFESSIIQEWIPSNRWTRRYFMEDFSNCLTQPVDWVVGAALMVRRDAYAQVGGFNPIFRMYSEEIEWCFRFRRHGWNVAYVSDAVIIHHEGMSTSQDVPRRQADFDASRIELHRRLYGKFGAWLARVIVRGNYLAHIGRESLKWLLGHRRELRRKRVRFYAELLRMDLDIDR